MAKIKPSQMSTTTLSSWEDVDNTLTDISALTNVIQRLEIEMNEKIAKIQEKYNDELIPMKNELQYKGQNVEMFCKKHKEEFDETRSRKLNSGIVGFRLGTGVLSTLKGYTWKACLQILKATKKAKDFIKVKEDINKDAIKSANLSDTELAAFGMHIEQKDTFYYSINNVETQITI